MWSSENEFEVLRLEKYLKYGPKTFEKARKAIILHTFGVQVEEINDSRLACTSHRAQFYYPRRYTSPTPGKKRKKKKRETLIEGYPELCWVLFGLGSVWALWTSKFLLATGVEPLLCKRLSILGTSGT